MCLIPNTHSEGFDVFFGAMYVDQYHHGMISKSEAAEFVSQDPRFGIFGTGIFLIGDPINVQPMKEHFEGGRQIFRQRHRARNCLSKSPIERSGEEGRVKCQERFR